MKWRLFLKEQRIAPLYQNGMYVLFEEEGADNG
jgi:hypothetical protein